MGVEIGGNAVSVCRFWEALDMAIAALMGKEGKDTNAPTKPDLKPCPCGGKTRCVSIPFTHDKYMVM